jgi:O-antigen biosynthesis alpha-1,3-rhamnosyltransferase
MFEAYLRFRDELRRHGYQGDVPLLKIVGDLGWKCSDIKHRLDDLCSQGYAQWTGYYPRSELAKIYASAHCLLFPSLHEGFGFPILEAMRSGTPVITSKRGAMQEVAGEAALLVDPGSVDSLVQAMLAVTRDPMLHKKLSGAGLDRQARYDWKTTADGTVNAYFRALQGKS